MREYSPVKTVRVVNFQSIQDSTLELGALSVVCGPNDAGKSALLRALRSSFFNDAEDLDIREGADRCSVTLNFDDDEELGWWKERGKGGCYKLKGQTYSKTGGQVPNEIASYLGIGVMKIDSTTELTPQVNADQDEQPFVLWLPGSVRARALGKATKLDRVVTAQMRCKKELDDSKKVGQGAEQLKVELESRLESLPDYESLGNQLEEIEADVKVVEESISLVKSIQEKSARLEVLDVQQINLEGSIEEAYRQVAALRIQYEEACGKYGRCVMCGGLVSHEECIV